MRGSAPAVRVQVRRRLLVGAAALGLVAAGAGLWLARAAGETRAWPFTVLVLGVSLGLVGLVVAWHRPRNRMGALFVAGGLVFGLLLLAAGTLRYARSEDGVPAALQQVCLAWLWLAPMGGLWMLSILLFPDGRFPGRGWRAFAAAGVVATEAVGLACYLFDSGGRVYGLYGTAVAPDGLAGPLGNAAVSPVLVTAANALVLGLPAIALVALVQRYRRSGPVVRQQIKWLLAGAAASVLVQLVVAFLPLEGTAGSVGSGLGLAVQPLAALGALVAILRYRLWEIDLVLSRALVYGLLWAAVSAVLLVPALAAGVAVGGTQALAGVALALVVTVVFQPIRARLERVVERVVYRNRPRGYAALARFGESLRGVAGVSELGPQLAEAVRSGLGVAWAGVWLRLEIGGVETLGPAGASGLPAGPSVLLPASVASFLRSHPQALLGSEAPPGLPRLVPEEPAALVPLVAREELVGLLACGERAGDPLGDADLELLGLIARQAALALRNVTLEGQLRERLEQIEGQAEQLRRSRERIVSAQDTERRRIERDLHDGAQRQLVALAVRLRRASAPDSRPAPELLEELAGEAEETVFAVQELARGIFPSILADRGLAAALRTQALRTPLALRVEVEPSLVGRRFDRETETALYFVALEALANVQKHAPDAAATVSLRDEEGGRLLVLELHDDGPGFDRAEGGAGTGLQNMEDRVAAAGGRLAIESRPGAGTWIRAVVPLVARVYELSRESTPSGR